MYSASFAHVNYHPSNDWKHISFHQFIPLEQKNLLKLEDLKIKNGVGRILIINLCWFLTEPKSRKPSVSKTKVWNRFLTLELCGIDSSIVDFGLLTSEIIDLPPPYTCFYKGHRVGSLMWLLRKKEQMAPSENFIFRFCPKSFKSFISKLWLKNL